MFVGHQLNPFDIGSELWNRWVVEKGVYGIRVGLSSDKLELEESVKLEKGFEWRGL